MKVIALWDNFGQWRLLKCRTSMSADISQPLVVAYKDNHRRPNLAYYARMREPMHLFHLPISSH